MIRIFSLLLILLFSFPFRLFADELIGNISLIPKKDDVLIYKGIESGIKEGDVFYVLRDGVIICTLTATVVDSNYSKYVVSNRKEGIHGGDKAYRLPPPQHDQSDHDSSQLTLLKGKEVTASNNNGSNSLPQNSLNADIYFPLYPGNKREYTSIDNTKNIEYITEDSKPPIFVAKSEVYLGDNVVTVTLKTYEVKREGVFQIKQYTKSSLMGGYEYNEPFEKPRMILPSSLTIGKTWNWNISDKTGSEKHILSIVGFSNIKTQLGDYDNCLKVNEQIYLDDKLDGILTKWYCPNIGFFRDEAEGLIINDLTDYSSKHLGTKTSEGESNESVNKSVKEEKEEMGDIKVEADKSIAKDKI